jgi:mannosyltransferase
VLIAAALLRLHNLQAIPLGNDEIAEVRWSSLPFTEMIDAVKRDLVHPPLDYFLQFILGGLGAPEWVRRLPGVIFGIGCVAAMMSVTRLWSTSVAGIAAGLLLALSPVHIRYSQEVRPYSLGLFLIAASALSLEWYLRSGRRPWAVAWFVAVFLAGFTLYFAGLCALIVSVVRLLMERKARLLAIAIAGWTILYLPWIGVVITAFRRRTPFPAETLNPAWWLERMKFFGSWPFLILVAIGIFASLRVKFLRTATAWFVIGTALQIAILQIRPHYSAARHLTPAWLGAFVLAGAGCALLMRSRITSVAAAALVICFVLFAVRDLNHYYRSGRPDWRAVATFVHSKARSGETIVLSNEWTVRNFGWYWLQLPPRADVRVERFTTSPVLAKGPLWIVSAQCRPRRDVLELPLLGDFSSTDGAEIRYVPAGGVLSISEPVCREVWE